MILIKPEDILHNIQLQKVLIEILDNTLLSSALHFKGGTCAAMLGYLDRFSVDLDFDLKEGSNPKMLQKEFLAVINKLGFEVESNKGLYFVVKYQAPIEQRNKLKLSVSDQVVKTNDYKVVYLPVLDRMASCQTIETMFANKLVAPIDRYKKYKTIAGRDVYDIYYFFSQGYMFKKEIIKERTGTTVDKYLISLSSFLKNKVTERILAEDLNSLLPYERFQKIRKILKSDTLLFIRGYLGIDNK